MSSKDCFDYLVLYGFCILRGAKRAAVDRLGFTSLAELLPADPQLRVIVICALSWVLRVKDAAL